MVSRALARASMTGSERNDGCGGLRPWRQHRQIRVLDQLIEIGAVLRRQRDADAGIGRQLMTEALVGLADRIVDPCHEFDDVVTVRRRQSGSRRIRRRRAGRSGRSA